MTRLRSRRRLLAMAVGFCAIFAAACGDNGTSSSGANAGPAYATQDPNAAAGGQLTLGIWQPQSSFLNAGIVDSQTFSYLIDSPAAEGLLWYRSTDETATAKSLADYYSPWLATEVPTTDNGDVKTSGCSNSAAKMCVTWKLRTDVTWHDGSKFTSADVCDTYNMFWLKYGISGKTNPTALLSTTLWDQSLDCNSSDPATAVINYKSTIGSYLALGTGTLGVLPHSILGAPDGPLTKNTDLEKYTPNIDLGAGSGHPAGAYKGSTQSMDNIIDGTGPYVFSSQNANQTVYVRNQNYWNKAHMPHIDKLIFKNEADLASEVNDAKSGTIDMAFDLRLYNLNGLLSAAGQASPKLTVQTIPDSGAEKIDINVCANAKGLCGTAAKASEYTADPVIRKAMLEGINRQNIIHQQAADKTTIPQDSWMSLGISWIADPSIPTTAFSADQANKDLDAAGYKLDPKCDGGKYRSYKDGTCINVNLGTTKSNPSRVATESLVQADLANIGIKVNEPFTPNETNGVFFGQFAQGGSLYTHNFDLGMYTNTVSTPAEPDSYYAGYHADCGGTCPANNNIPSAKNNGNGQNDTGTNDPALDAALDAGRAAVNLSDRATAYKQAEHILATDLPEIPLYQQITVDTTTPKLQGYRPNDLVWDYNTYDWYCTAGNCQAS